MKTPIEFDYDLWTTEEGKCMVRVKLTGEVCEVSRETMRVLRNEEKKLRRSKTGVPIAGCEDEDETATLLSLDFVSVQDAEEMSPAWLEDPNDLEETVLTSVMEQEFRLLLSERQLEVYADRRVFHQRQAVIRAAFEPHHAFPEKRLGV